MAIFIADPDDQRIAPYRFVRERDLVRDINGNGAVDGIDELFGDTLTDGYTALRARAAPLVRTSSQHAIDRTMRRS